MKAKNEQKSLLLVLKKEEQEQESLSNKVRGMKAFIEAEQAQVDSLEAYQEEYWQKIRSQSHSSVSEIQRYRSFCQQLEQALSQQRQKVRLANDKLVELQAQFIRQQRKLTILQDLIDKKGLMVAQQEEKQLQKVCDELALRPRLSTP